MKHEISEFIKKYAIFLVLVMLIAFFAIRSTRFFTISNAITIARQVSMNGIAAVGMTFVILIGGIDLSIGSQVAFIDILGAYMMAKMGVPPIWAVLICISAAIISGYIVGILVTVVKIPAFIATLALMSVLRGLALTISQGLPISGLPPGFKTLGQGYWGPIPIPVYIMLFIVALGIFMR